MKRLFAVFGLLILSLCALESGPSQAARVGSQPTLSTVRALLNTGFGAAPQLGYQVVDRKVQLAKGKFRFRELPSVPSSGIIGGASVLQNGDSFPSALTNLKDETGGDVQIPINAVIKQVLIDVLATPTAHTAPGYTASKLSLGINSTTDLLASTAVASWTGLMNGVPQDLAASMVKVLGRQFSFQPSNLKYSVVKLFLTQGSITSGEFNVFVEYYLSD